MGRNDLSATSVMFAPASVTTYGFEGHNSPMLYANRSRASRMSSALHSSLITEREQTKLQRSRLVFCHWKYKHHKVPTKQGPSTRDNLPVQLGQHMRECDLLVRDQRKPRQVAVRRSWHACSKCSDCSLSACLPGSSPSLVSEIGGRSHIFVLLSVHDRHAHLHHLLSPSFK